MHKCIFCKKSILFWSDKVNRYEAWYHGKCFDLREDMCINSFLNKDYETLEYINKVEGRSYIVIPKSKIVKQVS
jgi:hypothetical protein